MSATRLEAIPAGAYALLFAAPFLFAFNNVAARLADGVVPPVALSFWRWGLTILLLAPIVASSLIPKAHVLRREWWQLGLLGALGMTIVSIATYAGAKTTSASNIGLIYAATPGLILLFDRFATGIRLAPRQIAGLFACVSGMLVIIARGDPSVLLGARFAQGDLLVAAGTVGWAAYSVLLKHWPSGLGIIERAAAVAFAGAVVTLPLYLVEHMVVEPFVPTMDALWIILGVGVLSGTMLILAHAHLTARLGPRRVVVLLYMIPLYNIALAWAVLGERLTAYQAIGALLVLTGVYFSTVSAATRAAVRSSEREARR
jgi:drug/metabolite transporter (DMT)-like permease